MPPTYGRFMPFVDGGLGVDVPSEIPITSRGGRLQEIQGFLTGTLDTVSRFVNTTRTRGKTQVIDDRAPHPEPQQAQAVDKTTAVGLVLAAAAAAVVLTMLAFRKKAA